MKVRHCPDVSMICLMHKKDTSTQGNAHRAHPCNGPAALSICTKALHCCWHGPSEALRSSRLLHVHRAQPVERGADVKAPRPRQAAVRHAGGQRVQPLCSGLD